MGDQDRTAENVPPSFPTVFEKEVSSFESLEGERTAVASYFARPLFVAV